MPMHMRPRYYGAAAGMRPFGTVARRSEAVTDKVDRVGDVGAASLETSEPMSSPPPPPPQQQQQQQEQGQDGGLGAVGEQSTKSRVENRKERKIRRKLAAEAQEQEAAAARIKEKNRARRMKKKEERQGQDPASSKTTGGGAGAHAQGAEPVYAGWSDNAPRNAAAKAKKMAATKEDVGTKAKSGKGSNAGLSEEEGGTERRAKEPWMEYKAALKAKFGDEAWSPRKRISPDALAGMRALHKAQPEVYTIKVLGDYFKVSSENIRRILKSKWEPSEEETEARRERWLKRGEKKWSEMVELGIRPPKKWREMGVGRVGKGEVPAWKRGGEGKGAGERWIEQADADGFVMAGDMAAEEGRDVEATIGERIL